MEAITILLLIVLVVLIAAANIRWIIPEAYRDLKTNVPGPKGWPILGNVSYALTSVDNGRDTFRVIDKITKSYDAPLFSLWFGPTKLVIWVNDAKYIERLINHRALAWKSFFYSGIKKITKNGVFSRKGESWERLRKPVVHFSKPKHIVNFHEKIKYKVPLFCERFERRCNTGPFDVMPMCKAWSLDMYIYSNFDFDSLYSEEKFERMVHCGEKFLDDAFVDMVRLKSALGFLKLDEAESDRCIKAFTDELIDRRIAQVKEQGRDIQEVIDNPENYIDAVMQIGQQEGLPKAHLSLMLTDAIFGALDSPGIVMMNMILYLAMNPKYQDQVYQEQVDFFGDSLRPPEEDEQKNLTFLDMVMKEALRKCLPPVVSRKAEEDIEIDGYHIPKNATVVFSLDSGANDPKYWEKPDEFYPEHFLPEAAAKREKGAYLPFAGGPKMCPGQLYSYAVVRTAMSVVVRKFEFKTDIKPSDIEYNISLFKEVVNPRVSVFKRVK